MSYSNFNTFKLFQNVGINSSSDYVLSMEPNGNNISFHSSNSIDYNNVDIMSIKNIINKKQNEDLNLSSLTGTTINPVITINNNHSDCRIMTNLNVSGNLNIGVGTLNIGTNTQFYSSGSNNYLSDPSAPGNNKWKLYWKDDSTHTILGSGDANGTTSLAVGGIEVLTAKGSEGYVGLSNNTPGYILHVGTSSLTGSPYLPSGTSMRHWSLGNSGETYSSWGSSHGTVCAKFEKTVWFAGWGWTLSSDSRIKTNIVDVPDNLALQQLRSIPCRYYEYIDKYERGPDKTIGFIAQEVKEKMPMAVTQQKSIIPNVYKIINCTWTSNADKFNMNSSDLLNVNGIKYKFYVSNATDFTDEKIVEITGNSDNIFTFDKKYNNVFCYGSEVEDFHTLDKNKLFTLNFSATQEIDRIQQTHITEIASLKAENQQQQTKINTLETENQQQQTKIDTLETENQQQQTKINELTSIIDKLKTANSFEEFKNNL